ncbi:ABC transporter ATP-binding protein [Hyalangium sp.]|uniref:ABC transporter ATP-binding protein n=1 Tax=Hyalangium sp. TaxID=2028555 RepID=UPI002D551C06|nr:ABC transporter ATP-binding protein [Hyalangium sp.]HYI00895.1 ABC transporter ATP-binding protein [Hyalangium sp.]
MSPRNLIELTGITKDYLLGKTKVSALRGVDLSVSAGEFTVVTGPSGSGKTTLLNIIGCLDRATSGSYRLDGEEVGDRDFDALAEVRNRKIGFIFQSFNLIPVLDVAENIEFPCMVRKDGESRAALRKRVEALADAVGLLPFVRHRPDELSGGQRQRVAIARALITQPQLVLADEPTANLDSATSDQIIDLMLALNRDKGVTFLFSTHDPRVVAHARRALHLHDGRMLPGERSTAQPEAQAETP